MRTFRPNYGGMVVNPSAAAAASAIGQIGGNWAGGGGFGPGFPSRDQAASAYAVTTGSWEAIRQSLYDSQQYIAAGATVLTFFSVPLGQGTSWAGGGTKSTSDTNMQNAGSLPANNEFLVQSIEVEFWPTTPTVAAAMPEAYKQASGPVLINDAYIFRRAGSLSVNIGNKAYLTEAPLAKFPPKTKFVVQGAALGTTTADSISWAVFADMIGRPYAVQGLYLQSTQAFNVTLNWNEGVQAISNPARVFVRLDGILYRKSQ